MRRQRRYISPLNRSDPSQHFGMDPLSSSTPEQASGDSSGPSRFNELTECELGLPVTQAEHSTDDWVKAIGEEQDDADTYYWWQNPSSAPEYTTTDLETLCYPRKTLIGPEHCISTGISFLVNPKTRSKILTVQCSKCEGSRDYTLDLNIQRCIIRVGS